MDQPTDHKLKLGIIFGDEDCHQRANEAADMTTLPTYTVKQFDTVGEREAYLQGVKDAQGWDDYFAIRQN